MIILTVSMGDDAYPTGVPSCIETSHPLTCLKERDKEIWSYDYRMLLADLTYPLMIKHCSSKKQKFVRGSVSVVILETWPTLLFSWAAILLMASILTYSSWVFIWTKALLIGIGIHADVWILGILSWRQ